MGYTTDKYFNLIDIEEKPKRPKRKKPSPNASVGTARVRGIVVEIAK